MLTYLDNSMMTGIYDNTHDIPIYIDNGSTLNIMPTHFYDNAYYLHHLPKAPTAAKTIHTGNGPVKAHFWIDILLNVQGCMVQLKLLMCDTEAQTGILLSKMALEQLQTRQDYSTNTLYVKQTAIPLHAIQNIELLPERKTTIEVIADRTNELQYKELIEGQGIVWVWSNDSSKPLQPIVTTFHNDKTLITFENTTGQTQYISKGAKVAILDMRSKDRGMTNFEWDIPTDDEGNLVLYAHTFASSLEPTKLANEDPVLQAETKIEVSQAPNKHAVNTGNSKDPYPWLDLDDPRRKMTDEEILCLKVPFDKSILTAAEKERLVKLMLENTAAFSIRDEIATCPYFEVKLKLRDDKPFFVRPYNIREDQKPIIQKEMDRLEKLGIIRKGLTGYSSPVLLVKRKQQNLSIIMDDILIFSTKEQHWEDLANLFEVLIHFGLKISLHKCLLFQDKLVNMGLEFLIKDGTAHYTAMQDKWDTIRSMKAPKSVKECRTFCRMVNFLSTFCKNLRQLLISIYELTKKHACFVWTDKHQKAFEEI